MPPKGTRCSVETVYSGCPCCIFGDVSGSVMLWALQAVATLVLEQKCLAALRMLEEFVA